MAREHSTRTRPGRARRLGAVLGAVLAAAPVAAVPRAALAAAPQDTRFGVIASTQGREPDNAASFVRLYERQRARYAAPIGIRLFSAGRLPLPGDATMAGTLLTWAANRHPEELITVSHKTRDDARLRQLLDWTHAHRLRVSIIYFHEVQENWSRGRDPRAEPATYRAVYRAYRSVIAAHPARPRVTLEKNMMWFWQHYRAATLGGDWRLFVEARDPADVLSWDTYAFPGMPTAGGRYSTPDEFFRYARDAWREFHLPWGVGEIGSAVQDGTGSERAWDRDGALFAAWVRRITQTAQRPATIDASYAGMPPALFMKWWSAKDAADNDLSLEQVPAAVAAYRPLVRSRPL